MLGRHVDPYKWPLTACIEEWRLNPGRPHTAAGALVAATRIDETRRAHGIPSCTFPTIRRELPL